MGFTLLFDGLNHIRGEIKAIMVNGAYKVIMFLYQKCGVTELQHYYTTGMIEGIELPLESTGRLCFKDGDPFRPHGTNTADNFMELKVSPGAPGAFGCQVFMILPEYMQVEDESLPEYTKLALNKYMQVEDERLPEYTKLTLNSTFDGHNEKFWWKSENDSMLPDQIYFDSSKNIVINILNSTKDVPYFFRIGSGQPIPTFKFNFGVKCKHSKFELYLNLKSECHVLLHLSENGFSVSTNITSNIDFKGLPLSMVFVAPVGNVQECEKAEIVLLNSNIIHGTEVLIDRSKIVESINATTESESNSTIASFVTTLTSFAE
uniref:Uncharacterized protein n=1 Tax=Panagrolaimus sp. PS1159 TaxID=55785 RepID=A0AC35FKV7_9BILA